MGIAERRADSYVQIVTDVSGDAAKVELLHHRILYFVLARSGPAKYGIRRASDSAFAASLFVKIE